MDTLVMAIFIGAVAASAIYVGAKAVQRVYRGDQLVWEAGEPDAMVVEGAGTASVNGVYFRDGDENGKPLYTLEGGDRIDDSIYRFLTSIDVWLIKGLYISQEEVPIPETPDLVVQWKTESLGEPLGGAEPPPTVRRGTRNDL